MKIENNKSNDYERIEKAIHYLCENHKTQPSLEDIAKEVHLSPFHFQRMFKKWTGSSPKKFLQYISIENAKQILREDNASVFDTALETGLSGTSRLHDLFVNIEGMTPAEYKSGGKNLWINYSIINSDFGMVLIGSTPKGICHVSFIEEQDNPLEILKQDFPNAQFNKAFDKNHQKVELFFEQDWTQLEQIKLHLKGSDFQLKVWEALLKIPPGKLTTYGNIALKINAPKASRAVGTAIGKNPIALLIPCHRVIRSSGIIGDYRWGANRKKALIGREGLKKQD